MTQDEELASWREGWQALGGQRELTEELLTRVARDARRIRRGMIKEFAAAAGGAAVCVWLLVHSAGDLVAIIACSAILVFFGVWVTHLVGLRKGSLRAEGSSVDGFVELTARRYDDDLAWNTFGRRCTFVIAILIVPWGAWAAYSRYDMYAAEPWRAVVGFGTAALLLLLTHAWNVRARRKILLERRRFEELVSKGMM